MSFTLAWNSLPCQCPINKSSMAKIFTRFHDKTPTQLDLPWDRSIEDAAMNRGKKRKSSKEGLLSKEKGHVNESGSAKCFLEASH